MKKKLRSYKDLNHFTKGWIFARLKYNETIPEIAKHFNCSVITINRVIEERLNINKRMLKTKKNG